MFDPCSMIWHPKEMNRLLIPLIAALVLTGCSKAPEYVYHPGPGGLLVRIDPKTSRAWILQNPTEGWSWSEIHDPVAVRKSVEKALKEGRNPFAERQ